MKKILRKITPHWIISLYHYFLAVIATLLYGFPSRRMIIIGITGTKGKTSTANFVWSALESSGMKTGILSTANVRIGEKEILNPFHMTMPGRFVVQKFLKRMADEGCKAAIVETTSQGIVQHRHIGIWYDIAIFTNLTPEHIDSHGSFENYKNAKKVLFSYLSAFGKKKIDGKIIPKTIIANGDSEHAPDFLNFPADIKKTFSIHKASDYQAKNIIENTEGVSFDFDGNPYALSIPGRFNILNALPALAIGDVLGIPKINISEGLRNIGVIPGRMEEIKEGQKFKVIVDYAHEKQSMTNVLETAFNLKKPGGKIIILLGAEGGGRDKSKRGIMGELTGRLADFVICSNTDPYDDDPLPIAEDIAIAAESAGKVRDVNLFVILDRREGIAKALSLADENDVVLITTKGAEQSMIIGDKTIPWDDRMVVREELRKIL